MHEVGVSIKVGEDTYKIRRPNGIWGDGRRRYVIDLPTVIRNKLAALDFCNAGVLVGGVGEKFIAKYDSSHIWVYYVLELTDDEFKQWENAVSSTRRMNEENTGRSQRRNKNE